MVDHIDERVFERIQKMYAKAESARQIGSEAEAMLFMDHVQRLLVKYKLEMSDVDLRVREKRDPIKMHLFNPGEFGLKSKKVRVVWQEALTRHVTKAHFCDAILAEGNSVWLIGRRQDRQICEFMLVYLLRLTEELSTKAYVDYFHKCRKSDQVEQARGYRINWIYGFVSRIGTRFKEERQREKEAQAHNPNALIRLSQETAMIKAFVEQLESTGAVGDAKNLGLSGVGNVQGLRDGMDAADQVDLKRRGVQPGSSTQQVGSGQRLLGAGET